MYSNIALASSTGKCLIAVVDRCGSMRGGRLASVHTALHSHADRLKPQDTFGVVTFDDQAVVQVPARRIDQHDVRVVHALIDTITDGDSTDLSAGYLLGLSEARRHVCSTRAPIVLLSDGHANHGITQADHLADLRIGYVALPDLIEQAITWPLAVNVVPGDEVAGRIPDLTVTTARLLAETTQAKRDAAESLTTGNSDEAVKRLEDQGARLRERIDGLDPADPTTQAARDRLVEEREQLDKLVRGVKEREAYASRKSLMEDYSMESSGKTDLSRRTGSRDKRDF